MKNLFVTTVLSALVLAGPALAVGENEPELLKNLPASKQTLIQAIQQVAKAGETPTAAKFEYEDGALHLSVYASAKGTKVDAEHSILKEFNGDPKQATWKPKIEVFKDVEHISRAAEYHTLLEISSVSLSDIATKAQADGDTVVWAIPMVVAGAPLYEVGVVKAGKLQRIHYGLLDGKRK